MHVIATCSMTETHMSAAMPMAFMAIDLASIPGTSMSALQMGAAGRWVFHDILFCIGSAVKCITAHQHVSRGEQKKYY
jgi:hypothetical protein